MPLKDHQLAMLQRCFDIEKTAQMSAYKMGFMADNVAAGKTFVSIAIPFVEKVMFRRSSLNVIIVPQNICMQWMNEIKKFTGNVFKVMMLVDYSSISELTFSPSAISAYDIILTTPMYFSTLADFCGRYNITPRRIIIDEADTIANMINKKIPTAMTWFVSATMDRLPESKTGMIQIGKEVHAVEDKQAPANHASSLTTKKGGTLRPEELGTYEIPSRLLRSGERICRCDSDWIGESFGIPPPIKHKIVVSNVILDVIASLTYGKMLQPQQLESANARDFRNLRTGSEDEFDIIPTLLKRYRDRKEDAETTLKGIQNNMHMEKRAAECRAEVKRCTEYAAALRTQAAAALLCQGTFEQLAQPDRQKPPVASCYMCSKCQAGYCEKWLENHKDDACLRCGSQEEMEERNPGEPALADNKITKLCEIIRGLDDKPRVMVFAKYTQAFSDIRQQLADTDLVIKEADAGTTASADTMLSDFKSGKIDVLLAESSLFCSGMNLPEVTDVCFLHVVHKYSDKQIAGRAQRPGRKAPCRIWTFLHDNETSAYDCN